jgi:hypothetical protein
MKCNDPCTRNKAKKRPKTFLAPQILTVLLRHKNQIKGHLQITSISIYRGYYLDARRYGFYLQMLQRCDFFVIANVFFTNENNIFVGLVKTTSL